MPDWRDNGEWLAHQHRWIELGFRNRLEYLKLSSDFSKIIITSLITVNSGGLVAIPAYASLLKVGTPLKSHLFASALLFSLGLISAILCAYFTYRNYQIWTIYSDVQVNQAVHAAGQLRGSLLNNKVMADRATSEMQSAGKELVIITTEINAYHWYALTCGWIAILLFAVGGSVLATQLG